MSFIPKRKDDAKKGDHGKVLVIGGSEDYIGAPYLAGIAALRAGADWVTIAAPEKVSWAINHYSPDIITKKIKGEFFSIIHIREMLDLAEQFDAVIIGNGIGTRMETKDFVRDFCLYCPKPKIIDADALKLLHEELPKLDNAILTPHAAEFEMLTGEKLPADVTQRGERAHAYSKSRLVFLVKGPIDVITDKENIRYNDTGNPGMTVAGTGDVLAGIAGSFLAQTKDFLGSAYYAAYLNGKLGDHLLKIKGIGFTASDMVEHIPEIKKKLNI